MGPRLNTTENGEAFALYLDAKEHLENRTPIAIRLAIRSLERAVALEGSFPLACSALADCYSLLVDYGVVAPWEALTSARLAAGRALHFGPDLAEALTSSALVRQMDLDWPGAVAGFQAAIDKHPGYPAARQRFALLLACLGRDSESWLEIGRAMELSPESPAVAASAAWVPYYEASFEEAIVVARAAVSKFPGFSSAEVVLALSLIASGEPDEACLVLEGATRREPDNVSLHSLLAYARGRAGERISAETLLRSLSKRRATQYVCPYYLAIPHLGLGAKDGALSELEGAVKARSPQVLYLAKDPIFDPLRDNLRFQTILLSVGLAQEQAPNREAS